MLNKSEEISRVLGKAMRRCRQGKGIGREEIASRLNVALRLPLLGQGGSVIRKKITVSDLYELTRSPLPGRGAALPAEWLAGFCEVLDDYELALLLLPDRLKQVLAVGELAVKSHGTLARALAELEKIVKPTTQEDAATSKRGALRGK